MELVVGKLFKGKKKNRYCLDTSCWFLNCIFNVRQRNVRNECVVLCQRISLCVAAMLLNPDTHAKDCCSVTGIGTDAT